MISRLLFSRWGESGFGLLSMVLIIALLTFTVVTVIMMSLPGAATRTNRETVDRAESLRAAINSYRLSHGGVAGTFPLALTDLVITDSTPCVLANNPASPATYLKLQGWCGPYLHSTFLENTEAYRTDGWGSQFTYNAGTSVVTSCGPDRICGNADDIHFAP